jgi:hypothetical protein
MSVEANGNEMNSFDPLLAEDSVTSSLFQYAIVHNNLLIM